MSEAVVVVPTLSYVPTGATPPSKVPDAFTYHGVLLSPQGPGSNVFTSTYPGINNARLVVGFNNPVGAGQVLHNVTIEHIQAYRWDWGCWYPCRLTGYVNGVAHHRTFGVPGVPPERAAPSNVVVLDPYFTYLAGPATDRATDGTSWAACDRFEVEWMVRQTPLYNSNGTVYYYYGASYYLGYAGLILRYTDLPYATAVGPSGGPTTVPQPTITWWMAGGPQSSYQVVVVTSGAVDANGLTVFATGFDPLTANPVWDSGKVRSTSTSAQTGSLGDGLYVTCVRLWTDSPEGELPGPWSFNTPWTLDADNVNPPAVSITNDSATYTVQTTIAPGTPTGGFVNPQVYEVQYLDPDQGWVPINVNGGTTVGNTTTIFYDSLKRPGTSISYRARSRYTRSDGLVALTAWVTTSTTATDRKEWWLRCLTDRTLNRTLSSTASLVVQDWSPSRTRPQSVTWGIGAKYATVTHDVVKSATMSLSVWAMTAAARTALYALLEHDGDLVLVSPWAEMWRVRVGDQIEETQQRAAPRSGETTPLGMVRVVSFTLVEVG